MACENQVGIRNIAITFYDCDNDQTIGPISHELASDEQPTYRMCEYTNEPLPGGYVQRSKGSAMITLNVIRNLGIPLSLYQGCAAMDIQVEHFNGMVVTGLNGTPTGEEDSDGHSIQVAATFTDVDEFLPQSVVANA